METVVDLFDALGGVTRVAAVSNVPLGTASSWKTRGSIPLDYWPALIADAAGRGVEGVSYESLARIHLSRKEAVGASDGPPHEAVPA